MVAGARNSAVFSLHRAKLDHLSCWGLTAAAAQPAAALSAGDGACSESVSAMTASDLGRDPEEGSLGRLWWPALRRREPEVLGELASRSVEAEAEGRILAASSESTRMGLKGTISTSWGRVRDQRPNSWARRLSGVVKAREGRRKAAREW